jgi:exodeoxyribonuclease VII small subunit
MTEPGAADTVDTALLDDLTYEAAEGELVELIGKLEAGDVPLEDSLRMWERATLLRAVCAQLLTDARSRLTSGATGGARDGTAEDQPLAKPPEPADGPWPTPETAPDATNGWSDEPPF